MSKFVSASRWCCEQSLYGDNPVYYVLGQTAAGRYLSSVVIQFPDGKGYAVKPRSMTDKEERRYRKWKREMKAEALPKTDSFQELAQFWETHDLTDFEDELEEVTKPIFAPRTAIHLDLESSEAEAVRKIAEAKGIADSELIRSWVREKIGVSWNPGNFQCLRLKLKVHACFSFVNR